MQDWALSPLDISFLTVESPATPMTIGAVAIVDANPDDPDRAQLISAIRTRANAIPRLHRKLRADWYPLTGASWTEDRLFSLERHVKLHRTVGAGGVEELNAWIARVMMQQLDRARPLWEIHVLHGLADGTAAMLFKVHHAFLDGLGVGALAYAVADGGSPEMVPGPAHQPDPDGAIDTSKAMVKRLLSPLSGLTDPQSLARTAARALSTATGVVTTMTTRGPGLPFDTTVSPARAFASSSVAIEDVRGLRAVCGGSVNDIGIALLSGAMRSWLAVHHYKTDELRLRALVPVSKGRSGNGGSGNHFSAFLVELPVHIADPMARLKFVSEQMKRHRAAGPEGGPGALAGLTNLMPPAAVRLGGPAMANAASRLFDMLVTTIPVPRPLKVDGIAIREIYPLTPLGPNQPLALGVSSYGGRLFMGVIADPIVVPDPAALAAAAPAELAVLRTVAGLRAVADPTPRAAAPARGRTVAARITRPRPAAQASVPPQR